MFGKTKDLTEDLKNKAGLSGKNRSILEYKANLTVQHPSLIHFSSTPLFRLERNPSTYLHLLKKKDSEHLVPIVNYLIGNAGHMVYLGGDAVKNLYLTGRKRYKCLNVLAILPDLIAVDRYASILNNIISSNDGAFSMQLKYRVKKNWCEGCFKDVAEKRYIFEPRLEGFEKLLYPLRSSIIELDITTHQRFSETFGHPTL